MATQKEQRERHLQERAALERAQLAARRAQKGTYLSQVRVVRAARAEARPTAPAAFLGRVTGVALVISNLHRYRDTKGFRTFSGDRQQLVLAQKQAALLLQRRQESTGAGNHVAAKGARESRGAGAAGTGGEARA